MNKVFGYGLILLAAAATADRRALAWNSDPQNAGMGQFYLGSSNNSSARQGYFGVDVRDVTPDEVTTLKLRDTRGAEVVLVDHDAPAGKAGLREHDVILQMNGQAIQSQDQVRKMLHECASGRTIQLVISRDGQPMTITSQMSSREEVERAAWEQHLNTRDPDPEPTLTSTAERVPGRPSGPPDPELPSSKSFIGDGAINPLYTGALLENISAQLAGYFGVNKGHGVLVREVIANSPAEQAGIRAGDVIVRANDHTVTSTSEWTKALKSSHGKPLSVIVVRDRKEQTLTLTPDSKKRSSLDRPDPEASAPIDVARVGMMLMPAR